MRVCIYQPQYLPRLHYLNRLLDSDVFVCLDGAQYTKSLVHVEDGRRRRHRSFQSDTPILMSDGAHMLTVPVRSGPPQALALTPIDYSTNWPARHLRTIRTAYGKASHFEACFDDLQALLRSRPATLGELNTRTIMWALTRIMGADDAVDDLDATAVEAALGAGGARLRRLVTDAELGVVRPDGRQQGTEWTLRICRSIGAGEYMCGGTAAMGYMDFRAYENAGVRVVLQEWDCPAYEQRFGREFVANLSIVDLLMNAGPAGAREVLGAGSEPIAATAVRSATRGRTG